MKNKELSPEDRHEMLHSLVTNPGFYILVEEIDVIINRIRDRIHGCKLSNDPVKDGLGLLQERYKLEGALALKNAIGVMVQQTKDKENLR